MRYRLIHIVTPRDDKPLTYVVDDEANVVGLIQAITWHVDVDHAPRVTLKVATLVMGKIEQVEVQCESDFARIEFTADETIQQYVKAEQDRRQAAAVKALDAEVRRLREEKEPS